MSRPFPWHEVPSLTRHELEAERSVLAVPAMVSADALLRGAEDLLQCTVSLQGSAVERRVDVAAVDPSSVGVVLGHQGAEGLAEAFLIETESALASALVCGALGQKRPRVLVAERPTAALCGSTAAVLVALGRRGGLALRVFAAGPLQELARDLERAQGPLGRQAGLIELGSDTFSGAIWRGLQPRDAMRPGGNVSRSQAPIRLTLVAARCELTVAEVRALGVGDVFVPLPALHTLGAAGLLGPVTLTHGLRESGLGAKLTEAGLEISFEPVALGRVPGDHGTNMPLSDNSVPSAPATMQDLLDDAPVVLRVEVGHAELPAREWAGLRPGDVIPLGVTPSQPVVLRVSGTELARGTLVLVDGEVGVRITEKVTP
jgi:flagellar motor switch protein FliN